MYFALKLLFDFLKNQPSSTPGNPDSGQSDPTPPYVQVGFYPGRITVNHCTFEKEKHIKHFGLINKYFQ